MKTRVTDDPPADCRAVVEYGPEGAEIVRMDDRLEESGPREGTLELIQSITDQALPDGPFGTHEATVYRFEDVTVVHRPDGEGGRIATFDPSAAERSLDRLLEEVRSV